METVLPAILGLSAAAIFSAVAFICAKHLRARNKKMTHLTRYPFQPTRRSTAVRSPSGQAQQYLKKPPSPTSAKQIDIAKPTQSQSVPNTAARITLQSIELVDEDEIRPKTVKRNDSIVKKSPTQIESRANNMHDCNGWECGKLGTIFFKLRYLKERCALVVSITRCRGLPCKASSLSGGHVDAGINGRTEVATDPYVKLQLLPEKKHKAKTRVVRNARNPVYDEDFTFYGLNIHDLRSMTLHFVILSFDRYSRDDVIGEVVWPLSSISLKEIELEHMSINREIQPRSLKIRVQGRGELLISLCWQPATGRLTVVLLKARNLPRMDVTGLADPYVKIYLLFNGQRIGKKKTHVKKRTLSPVFNESFAFDIPAAEGTVASLDGVSLEMMLLDWDRVTKNEVIGRLELGGPNSNRTALSHWNEVCDSPRRQIAEWHKLNE